MNEQIVNFLENQGFNDKDTKVYLDVFAHGQSFASTIALRNKLDRTTVYSVLKRLIAAGVIAQTKIEGVSAYVPISPSIFLNQIEQDIAELEARKKVTHGFISEMQKLQKVDYHRPKIQIYEGDAAVISLYEYSLSVGGEQKAFLTLRNIPEAVEKYLRTTFIETKLKNNVNSQVLVAESDQAKRYQGLDLKSNRKTKIITKHPFELHAEIILFGGKEVAIIDFHKQAYGIVIQSQTLYDTMATLFACLWENC
jgi:sugar-specific transcriptional regulator TrmB